LIAGGLRIDQRGSGISYFKFAKSEGKVNLGSEVERERTIRSTQAGYFPQERFYKRFYAVLGLIVLTPRAADSLSNQKVLQRQQVPPIAPQ
jgi:hypothetical protein